MTSSKLLALATGFAFLFLSGCSTNLEMRDQLRHIQSVSINQNVDFSGEGFVHEQPSPFQQAFVVEFIRQVDQKEIFPNRVVVVRTSLQSWREEVGEMKYDGQFKLNVRPGAKEGIWVMEAILQSRYGVVVWRSSRMVKGEPSGPTHSAIQQACAALVRELKKAYG